MNTDVGVAAVILAAGESSRLGQPKQLVRFEGGTLIAHAVQVAIGARCAPVIVVVGAEADSIRDGLPVEDIEIVANPNWKAGVGTSIRSGIRFLIDQHDATEAVILLACDQPLISADSLRALIEAHVSTGQSIVASSYAGTLGIPALFGRTYLEKLLVLSDEEGAKEIILSHLNHVAKVPHAAAALDIDTPLDLATWRSASKAKP